MRSKFCRRLPRLAKHLDRARVQVLRKEPSHQPHQRVMVPPTRGAGSPDLTQIEVVEGATAASRG